MNEIKVSAKTYDEALTKALIELQTVSDNVEIEVLSEGTEGLFGILGGKPWEIKVSLKKSNKEEKTKEFKETKDTNESEVSEEKVAVNETKEDLTDIKEEPKEEVTEEKKELPPVEDVEELTEKAMSFLKDVMSKMQMAVDITSSFDHSSNELYLSLAGDDMGVLIGKRGQTLDSLQYLTSLVVNKHRDSYIRVKLDTENYRERREEKLKELAHNIAEKVKRTRHAVELEPMNPYERRVIHSALQGDETVTTISEGEEPYRYVVVLLKKDSKRGSRHKYSHK